MRLSIDRPRGGEAGSYLRVVIAALAGSLLLAAPVLATGPSKGRGAAVPAEARDDDRAAPPGPSYEMVVAGGSARSSAGLSYEAANPSQGVRALLTEAGVRVTPAEAGERPWELEISFTGLGRGTGDSPAGRARISAEGPRLVWFYAGANAWLTNGERGLEEGFTIAAPFGDGGPAAAEPLSVEMALAGNLTAVPDDDGAGVGFVSVSGDAFMHGAELRAVDADGLEIEARFETIIGHESSSRGFKILLQDAGHAYPVTVSYTVESLHALKLAPRKSPATNAYGAGDAAALAAAATDENGTASAAPLDEEPFAAPPNDTCAGAEVIPGGGPGPYLSTVTASITDATTTGDPVAIPPCTFGFPSNPVSRSVWYAFTPSVSGAFTVSVCADAPTGSTVDDTVMAIYTSGAGCGGPFTQITDGCDDDSCGAENLQSVITANLASGTTYYVVVWKFDTTAPTAGNTAIQVRITVPPPPPPNDDCAAATTIPTAGPFPFLTSTIDLKSATTAGDPAFCATTSHTAWYTFTPATTGTYDITTCQLQAPGTTAVDTALGIYTGGSCGGALTSFACNNDDPTCGGGTSRSRIQATLFAGTQYFIVVGSSGLTTPSPSNVQLSIQGPPANDTCSSAPALSLDRPVIGTTTNAGNEYQLSGSACFTGVNQTAAAAPGRDVVYAFTAPSDDNYSFKAQNLAIGGDLALYTASSCPTATPGTPVTVATCLGASNRNTSSGAFDASEEVFCLPLTGGQQVFVYVDEVAVTMNGGSFRLEVNRCPRETEPDDAPGTASTLQCGIEGTISPAGDADFYALGTPATGARLFALADGVAAGPSKDFDMRVTMGADTLEYDDFNADIPFGGVSPTVGGTKMTGAAAFVRMSQFSALTSSEPYRLYAVIQPPSASAAAESEPNGTIALAQGNVAAGNYFAGALAGPAPSTDIDIYPFLASPGDLVLLGLDGDPAYDNTPINAALALLNSGGTVLSTVNDGGTTSTTRTPVLGSLVATAPAAPAESLAYRITQQGTYYARVSIGTISTTGLGAGDYLLSISKNCQTGGGGALTADLSVTNTEDVDPVVAGQILTYTVTVSNAGPADAFDVVVTDAIGTNVTFVSTAGGSCTEDPNGVPVCSLGTIGVGSSKQYTIKVRVTQCIGSGIILQNTATVAASTSDPNGANNSASASTTVTDLGTCNDGNACTTNDACSGAACVGGPAPNCDDGLVCTTDSCVPATGCAHTNNTASCDDGDLCTTNDTCSGGACAGSPVPCNDGIVCTNDTCNPSNGQCVFTNNTAPCNDGNTCTGNDVCAGGVCGGTPLTVPTEVTNLQVLVDKQTLVWNTAAAAGPGTVHDVPRGLVRQLPVGSGAAETCFASGVAAATATEQGTAPTGNGFWYLVRGRNSCGAGPYGFTSGGSPEIPAVCP